ncbi:MAG: type I restriction enzyme HsdR N-terminal domain-containing protein [Methanotrichaceae archaeon]|nr:type I restriction enzyme HsdR N-terminal domain-containing protein [Methanotrichaceae archaeon]
MDLIDKIRETALRIPNQIEHIQTEEATKNALVLPFINALGYNIFDPTEVVPEFTADVGVKKGEKVDYAILKDKRPIVLFECKWCGADLDKEHASQLFRYFSVTDARFGVLTNGIIYRFYSDLDQPNKMDSKPFIEFNMLDIKEQLVNELKRFSKSSFELNSNLAAASELKYMGEIRRLLEEEMINPSDDFVKFFASQVYPGKLTQPVREQFTKITKNTFKQFITDKINDRLKFALAEGDLASQPQNHELEVPTKEEASAKKGAKIITTEVEIEGYNIVKSVSSDVIDVNRLTIKDTSNYCAIVLDNSSRKTICRLYFNGPQKYIGIFDELKNEEKIRLDEIKDISYHKDKLYSIIKYYDSQKPNGPTEQSMVSFVFKGQRYEVRYWKDMFIQICNMMASTHKDRFEDIFQLSGRKNPLFSRDPADLRSPAQIEGTDIYVEVSFGAKYLIKLAKKLISIFGYSEDDLEAEYQ